MVPTPVVYKKRSGQVPRPSVAQRVSWGNRLRRRTIGRQSRNQGGSALTGNGSATATSESNAGAFSIAASERVAFVSADAGAGGCEVSCEGRSRRVRGSSSELKAAGTRGSRMAGGSAGKASWFRAGADLLQSEDRIERRRRMSRRTGKDDSDGGSSAAQEQDGLAETDGKWMNGWMRRERFGP